MASIDASPIMLEWSVAFVDLPTYSLATPSTTSWAEHAEVEYWEVTLIAPRARSSSMNVISVVCVSATPWSGTPKYL